MVYVVSRWWFPTHKREEIAKVFQKVFAEERPEPVGEVVVFSSKGSKNGVVGMTFRKVAPENIAAGMREALTIMANYDEVEGYEYSVEVWADLMEAPGES